MTNISSQDLGELRLLVRFEVDACLEGEADSSLGGLVSQTASLNIAATSGQMASESSHPIINGLKVVHTSNPMAPQRSLVEIKTKKSHAQIKWNDVYPQLYLSGTPHLMVGYHLSGRFTAVKRYDADGPEEKMVGVREKTQEAVNKLAVVLRLIRDAVLDLTEDDAGGDRSERLLSLVCQKKKLKLYERTDGSKLPKELVAHFCD